MPPLYVISEEPRYDLAIKRELAEYDASTISPVRPYPSLDALADEELIKNDELDERTDQYEITDEGVEMLETRQEWEARYATSSCEEPCLVFDVVPWMSPS